MEQHEILCDLFLAGHVCDAGQREHGVRPPGGQERRRKPQRVRYDHVVVGQPVDEHERAFQPRCIIDQRVMVVSIRVLIRVTEIALCVKSVIKPLIGDWSAGHGCVEDVGASKHGQRGQVTAMGPAADADPG